MPTSLNSSSILQIIQITGIVYKVITAECSLIFAHIIYHSISNSLGTIKIILILDRRGIFRFKIIEENNIIRKTTNNKLQRYDFS